ncbi:MAG: ABC transporter substrate-binding protein [Methanobacteriota archaeon]|nr:MAG: ABC transporter substrate-binding protein [Euryarchaeota archaeon]
MTSAEESVDVDRRFTVGVSELYVDTLNPITLTRPSEWMAVFPCYSALLQYDDRMEIDGDLARFWSVDGPTWHFELVDNAYFVDPLDPTNMSHPVTASDVIFTYSVVRNVSGIHPLGAPNPEVTFELSSTGPYDVSIELNQSYAPIVSSLVSIPILPEYIWEAVDPLSFENNPPIGSGPFYYATDGLPESGEVVLERNPIWYMEDERGWKPRTDSWVLKECGSWDWAFSALTDGEVDFMIDLPRDLFLDEIPLYPELVGFGHTGGFVYEFNLNQMTDEMRDALGGPFSQGTNNQLLLNQTVKMAMAMCVDKDAFVLDVLDGCGVEADSLVPLANPWHYAYGEAPEEELIPFDTDGARAMLTAAGWVYDKYGNPATSETVPLCKAGGSDVLSFRFATIDTEQEWIDGSMLIKGWCAEAGIELDVWVHSVSEMNSIWYCADYDVWLWDWIFGLASDPSDILSLMTTDEIGSWSDCFWSNSTYDALYNESLVEMDGDVRRGIVNEMQAMLYEDASCQCVAYRDDLYAANVTDWCNYGDLEADHMLLPDVTPTWLSLRIHPTDNHAPVVQVDPCFEGCLGEGTAVTATIWDDDPTTDLEYRWFWGDGTSTDWIVGDSGLSSHLYSVPGEYTAYVAAREASSSNGYDDYFMTSNRTTMIIHEAGTSYDLELVAGWNLITVPLVNHSYEASTLELSAGDMISRWDPETQTYDKNYIVGISASGSDFAIEPSWSYWIFSGTTKSLTLWGDAPSGTQSRNITVPPGGGWVQIGLASLRTDLWASDVVDMYDPPLLEMVSRWNADTQTYDNYVVEFGLIDFQLNPGDGLWLYVGVNGELSYEP